MRDRYPSCAFARHCISSPQKARSSVGTLKTYTCSICMENSAHLYIIMHIFIICMYKCVYKRIHSVTNMYFVHYIYAKVYKPTFHLFTKACRFVGLSSPTQQPLSIGNILLFYKTLFIMIFFTPSLEL